MAKTTTEEVDALIASAVRSLNDEAAPVITYEDETWTVGCDGATVKHASLVIALASLAKAIELNAPTPNDALDDGVRF